MSSLTQSRLVSIRRANISIIKANHIKGDILFHDHYILIHLTIIIYMCMFVCYTIMQKLMYSFSTLAIRHILSSGES